MAKTFQKLGVATESAHRVKTVYLVDHEGKLAGMVFQTHRTWWHHHRYNVEARQFEPESGPYRTRYLAYRALLGWS